MLSTLDSNSGNWQAKPEKSDREKALVMFHRGMYEILQMSFGLNNAAKTFQCAMDVILSEPKGQIVLAYLDDIVVFSR